MNANINALAEQAADTLQRHLIERGDEILKAWDDVVKQAAEDEKDPVLRIGFTIAVDLTRRAAVYRTGFSVRNTIETATQVPDPNQLELDTLKLAKGSKAKAKRN